MATINACGELCEELLHVFDEAQDGMALLILDLVLDLVAVSGFTFAVQVPALLVLFVVFCWRCLRCVALSPGFPSCPACAVARFPRRAELTGLGRVVLRSDPAADADERVPALPRQQRI